MPATRVFVSHSSQDNEWCRAFVAALQTNGFDVWYDEQGLSGGSAWVEALQREVQGRDVFVLVVTPESMASQWCQEEIQLAMATRRTILPVLYKPTKVGGFLLTRQWVDVVGIPAEAAAQRVTGALMFGAIAPVAQAPKQIAPAPQIVPPALQRLGFTGRIAEGVEVITPPLCDVPAGPFLMGSDPRRDLEAGDAELPQRRVEVAAFRIARYPVTVAEYACACRAGAGREPRDWEKQRERPDHPVVQLSWKGAVAYAGWLAEVTNEPWRVPTEEEWEKAARGTDGRIYPWGDRFDPSRANTDEGGPQDTTPVWAYPGGVSPYGVYDMAGNASEWCGLPDNSPLFRPGAWDEAPRSRGYMAGGGWNSSPVAARAARRGQFFMGERDDSTGMRLVFAL